MIKKKVIKNYEKLWEKVESLLDEYLNAEINLMKEKNEDKENAPSKPADPKNLNYIVTCIKRAQEGRKLLILLRELAEHGKSGDETNSENALGEISKIIKSMQNGDDEEGTD